MTRNINHFTWLQSRTEVDERVLRDCIECMCRESRMRRSRKRRRRKRRGRRRGRKKSKVQSPRENNQDSTASNNNNSPFPSFCFDQSAPYFTSPSIRDLCLLDNRFTIPPRGPANRKGIVIVTFFGLMPALMTPHCRLSCKIRWKRNGFGSINNPVQLCFFSNNNVLDRNSPS